MLLSSCSVLKLKRCHIDIQEFQLICLDCLEKKKKEKKKYQSCEKIEIFFEVI